MKKTIAIVLTLVLCLGLLAGCGKKADDKVITVTNLPAVGKSTTLTLSPVSPLKVKSSSTKTVKVVSVADDATEFEEREYCFSNLLRYVSCTCPCTLKETGSGTLSAKKLRGSIPSG